MSWLPFDGGKTLGERGSEGGTIVLDDEHPSGARITLEQGGSTAPWAITCGVYGAMVHTCFFGDRATADEQLAAMKRGLEQLLLGEDEDLFHEFVRRFP